MKTPEDIKKGLECCSDADGFDGDCIKCPYKGELWCGDKTKIDALAYIQQLECQIGELTEKVVQLEKERNALLADLREADMEECNHCAHYVTAEAQGKCDGYCWACGGENCPCKACRGNSNWKWRGVQEGE